MMGVDPRRFGPYATRGYLKEKNEEAYANVFSMHYPDEERHAARPLKTTPCYDRMKDLGAVFGSIYGWERPNWFAPEGYGLKVADLDRPDVLMNKNYGAVDENGEVKELWSFRRSNYFEHVGNECKNVMENVGILDMSAFAKCFVSGPGARDWLDGLMANRIPKAIGRVNLCHMLNPMGGVRAEFTIYKMAEDRYYLVSAGAFERHDHDYLKKALPKDGSVTLHANTEGFGVLVVAGPRSRDVMQKLTDEDISNENFKWLTGRPASIAHAESHLLRVNFVGELGFEIHHPIAMQNVIFDAVMEAGAEFGIKPFGIRAMDCMRLEKSYRLIPREMSIEYSAYESGLHRFVHPNKGDFIGRDALVERHAKGDNWTFVTMEVHGVTDVDARGSEAIYQGDKLIGRATSGGYGWRLDKSLALAMVEPDLAELGTELEILILGERYKVTVIEESPYDPENVNLRA